MINTIEAVLLGEQGQEDDKTGVLMGSMPTVDQIVHSIQDGLKGVAFAFWKLKVAAGTFIIGGGGIGRISPVDVEGVND